MSPIAMDVIELRTNDPAAVVRLSHVEKFSDGSGYRCELTVVSGDFSCRRPFYFDEAILSAAVRELESMATGKPGTAFIKAEWEEDFLRFQSNDMGHVWVSGEIFEHAELTQRLKFAFRTDQTVLLPLVRDLRVLQEAEPVDAGGRLRQKNPGEHA